MAEAMKIGYHDIFQRNKYAYSLSDDKLKNLVVEITGREPTDTAVRAIVGSFKACKQLADFDALDGRESFEAEKIAPLEPSRSMVKHEPAERSGIGQFNLGYTININFPETSNIEVYDAIFTSIKQNLLTDAK